MCVRDGAGLCRLKIRSDRNGQQQRRENQKAREIGVLSFENFKKEEVIFFFFQFSLFCHITFLFSSLELIFEAFMLSGKCRYAH